MRFDKMGAKSARIVFFVCFLLSACSRQDTDHAELLAVKTRISSLEIRLQEVSVKLADIEKILTAQEELRSAQAKAQSDLRREQVQQIEASGRTEAAGLFSQFQGRLGVGITYTDYLRALGDLAANLAKAKMQIESQNAKDQIDRILSIYTKAARYWELALPAKMAGYSFDRRMLLQVDLGIVLPDDKKPTAKEVEFYWQKAGELLEKFQ